MYSCAPRSSASTTTVKGRKGKSLRIDLHCHYANPEVAAKVADRNPGQYDPNVKFANALTRETNMKQMRDRAPKLSSIEVRLKDMDRMGIVIQAVSPAPQQTYYWTDPGEGQELARMVNNRLAEIVSKWPDRFVALGTVPLQNADLAVSELTHCVKTLGLRGVEINPNVNGMDLTDPRLNLEKFFAKVQELDVIIFMHPIGFTQGERLLDHYFNNVIGNPLETTVAASHLIFDGVMERYPKLKVVLPHGGGFLAHYWERMNHGWKARPDCFTDEVVLELKTTGDVRPRGFARTRRRFGYDLKAAHYVDAVWRLSGRAPRFAYIAVELAAPHYAWLHELSPAELARAGVELAVVQRGIAPR